MSDEVLRSSSDGAKPPKPPWWPRDRFTQVVLTVLLILTIPFLIEYVFQPLHSQHFMRLAANREDYRPYAIFMGVVTAGFFTFAFWRSKDAEHNRGKFDTPAGQVRFVTLLLPAPFLSFYAGWILVTFGVPLVQHQFASKTNVEIPFTITGFEFGRHCRGVTGVNPLFSDHALCGVKRSGHSSEWVGRRIIVIGRQSRYGMTMDRYQLDNVARAPVPALLPPPLPSPAPVPTPTPSTNPVNAISQAFRRCIRAPKDVPKPFDVLFQVEVGAKGEILSMQVLHFRSSSSPAHQSAAEAIIAGVKSCSSLGKVPAGRYMLPVIVRG